jgi:hypothetical protein
MAFATRFVSPRRSCSKRMLAAVWRKQLPRFAVERGAENSAAHFSAIIRESSQEGCIGNGSSFCIALVSVDWYFYWWDNWTHTQSPTWRPNYVWLLFFEWSGLGGPWCCDVICLAVVHLAHCLVHSQRHLLVPSFCRYLTWTRDNFNKIQRKGKCTHISLLHKPLTLSCIETVCRKQKLLLKCFLVDLNRENGTTQYSGTLDEDHLSISAHFVNVFMLGLGEGGSNLILTLLGLWCTLEFLDGPQQDQPLAFVPWTSPIRPLCFSPKGGLVTEVPQDCKRKGNKDIFEQSHL